MQQGSAYSAHPPAPSLREEQSRRGILHIRVRNCIRVHLKRGLTVIFRLVCGRQDEKPQRSTLKYSLLIQFLFTPPWHESSFHLKDIGDTLYVILSLTTWALKFFINLNIFTYVQTYTHSCTTVLKFICCVWVVLENNKRKEVIV